MNGVNVNECTKETAADDENTVIQSSVIHKRKDISDEAKPEEGLAAQTYNNVLSEIQFSSGELNSLEDTEKVQDESRVSSAISSASAQKTFSDDNQSIPPSRSSSRLSSTSNISTVSSRTCYPKSEYPRTEHDMMSHYPPHGYPDIGYPTGERYPSVGYPKSGQYPKSMLPGSPYPMTPLPTSRYPITPFPAHSYPMTPTPPSPYPDHRYPETHLKTFSDYSVSEVTSLVFSEDLNLTRPASEMYPQSVYPRSETNDMRQNNT